MSFKVKSMEGLNLACLKHQRESAVGTKALREETNLAGSRIRKKVTGSLDSPGEDDLKQIEG